MPPFLSKKSAIKLKILGWYQIVGGAFGVLLTFWLLAKTEQVSGLLLILYLAAFSLYAFSVWCGRLLLTDKYIKGLNLTIVNQAMQIISFTMLGYAFMYVSGAMLLGQIEIDHGFTMGFHFGLSSEWRIYFQSDDRSFNLAINFVAIYLLYFTDKLHTTIKNEKAGYEEEQLNEVTPGTLSGEI